MHTRRRASTRHIFKPIEEANPTPLALEEPLQWQTLGAATGRETKIHRKRVLRNKVQKAK